MIQKISIVRGTTQSLEISVSDSDGQIFAPQDGDKLVFGVKSNPNSTVYDILKTLTSDNFSDGKYLLELTPEDTAGLAIVPFWYDVGLQRGDDYYIIIEKSPFELAQNITTKEG